jgi:23S rRNA pseudouridine1911/1915/1917 synthase
MRRTVTEQEPILTFSAGEEHSGLRLDHFLQAHLPEYSRSRIQQWIKHGRITVGGVTTKASLQLKGGEMIVVRPAAPPPLTAEPEEGEIHILYEDSAVLAIDKPAGLTVHSGAGAHSGTLVNRLLKHFESLSSLGGEMRPGIVHRIDKDTSGVLLVARSDAAHRALAEQFSRRTIEKIYLALVEGTPPPTGRITAPITRDPKRRTRMTARLGQGRPALTEYRVLQQFPKFALLEVLIGTGRTHQIRVHLASIGHPVAGDRLYGAAAQPARGRFFLHAARIGFVSPADGRRITVESPLPAELRNWLDELTQRQPGLAVPASGAPPSPAGSPHSGPM